MYISDLIFFICFLIAQNPTNRWIKLQIVVKKNFTKWNKSYHDQNLKKKAHTLKITTDKKNKSNKEFSKG